MKNTNIRRDIAFLHHSKFKKIFHTRIFDFL